MLGQGLSQIFKSESKKDAYLLKLLGQAMVYATMEKGFHLSRQGRINASDLQTAWKLLEYE